MAEVTIEKITKSYRRGQPVLQDLSLTIRPGELFFLLGPSGCGKSTLLRILAGLVEPDSGTIAFDGRDVSSLPPEKRHAAMVFQNYALWPHMTVFENVAFGPRTAGCRGAALKNRVMEALETVRLADCSDRKVAALSGGQQQRVALARALAVEPALLLLDEPLSNLDARLRDAMRREIRRICRERKQTTLYVTHDRQEAFSMADRAAIMQGGVIRQLGVPEELYRRPKDRFCAEFLGDVNFLKGTLLPDSSFRFGELAFPLPAPELAPGPATLALRPEQLHFCNPAGTGTAAPECAIPAEIVDRVFLGECCEWRCRAGETELLVRETAAPPHPVGSRVTLAFAPEDAVLLQE